MKTNQFPQPILTARTTNQRRWLWLALGLSAMIATLAISFATARYPQAQLGPPIVAQSGALDPAVQGVASYLRAHASVGQAAAIDPAVAGVASYLRAHASVSQAAIDPAVQSVNGYLRAHDIVLLSSR